MLSRSCAVQIQLRKHALLYIMQILHAPTGQHGQIIQIRTLYLPCLTDLDHEMGIDHTDHVSDDL